MWDDWAKIAVFLLPFVLILLTAVVWLFLRKTIRTRLRVSKQLRDDPDINEWVVVFDWSRKILYLPTVIAALIAAGLMYLGRIEYGDGHLSDFIKPELVGGIWLGIFFVNFLIEEYEVNIKVLVIAVLATIAIFLWLGFLGWIGPFLRFFRNLGVRVDALGYLLIAGIFLLAAAISWIRGLFFYVAITPNFMNVQAGPTETGQHIGHEDYNTNVDTGDFLERLFGFGRIGITFRDRSRMPMMLLVGRIGKAARRLEAIRSKIVLDRPQPAPEAPSPSAEGNPID